MIRNTTRNQKLGWVLFIAYLALLVYFLIFSESLGRDASQRDYAYNLELFKEIRRFYVYRKQLGMEAFLLNVFGNVIAFMPCGFFLPIVSRRSRKWYNTVLLGFLLSLSVETLQLVLRVGSFDVDDSAAEHSGRRSGISCKPHDSEGAHKEEKSCQRLRKRFPI